MQEEKNRYVLEKDRSCETLGLVKLGNIQDLMRYDVNVTAG